MKLATRFAAISIVALSGTIGAWASTVVDLHSSTTNFGGLALFINNEGDVAGQFYTNVPQTKFLAFFYSGITQTTNMIGPFPSGGDTQPTGLNASGQVSGIGDVQSNNTQPNAFVYSNGTLIDLESANNSTADSLNDSGTVVGSITSAGNTHGMVVTETSPGVWNTPVDIGTTGGTAAEVDFINNAGAIAGTTNTLAFYSATATALNSGDSIGLTGATLSTPNGMNASGQVIGESNFSGSGSNQHAFLYTPGTTPVTTDLGTLILNGPNYVGSSDAEAINASGEVVGQSDYASSPGVDSGHHEAFMYTGNTMTALGLLSTYTDSVANAVNDVGVIVGTDMNSTTSDAFIYMNGQLTDLTSLLPDNTVFTKLLTATGINDNNGVYQIIGQGLTVGGKDDAYILNIAAANPTPEPSTVLSITLGLMILTFAVKRRERARVYSLARIAASERQR